MKSTTRRHFPMPFVVRPLGANDWVFTVPGVGPQVLVRGAAPAAAALLATGRCEELTLQWQENGLRLYVSSVGVRRVFEARFAVVHEVPAALYGTLPLGRFDDAAARFWRRVFRLARFPGGFLLLRFIARRRRRVR